MEDIKQIQAGYVPAGTVLVYRFEELVYEYDPHPFGDPSGHVSYHSKTLTRIYEAGKLAPIEHFEKGILLTDGESTWGMDESDYFYIRNHWGQAIIDDAEPDFG